MNVDGGDLPAGYVDLFVLAQRATEVEHGAQPPGETTVDHYTAALRFLADIRRELMADSALVPGSLRAFGWGITPPASGGDRMKPLPHTLWQSLHPGDMLPKRPGLIRVEYDGTTHRVVVLEGDAESWLLRRAPRVPKNQIGNTGRRKDARRGRPTAPGVADATRAIGAILAADGTPEPGDGRQASLERRFIEVVESRGGSISEARARVHVKSAIEAHIKAMA